MDPATSALLTDLYQLNMMQAYLDRGETKTAVFEFFVRKLPRDRGFLIAAGLEQVLEFLEGCIYPVLHRLALGRLMQQPRGAIE